MQGRGLDAELGGSLKIRGTTDAPVVSGPGFDLLRGTFSLAGSTLVFDNTSRVSFDGAGLKKSNLDPTLDFTATSTVQNTTVKLQISGYADAPKFEFSSTTGLAQDEIMALLLFGQPAAQLSALQVAQVGAALATLSGVGGSGGNPLTKVQKLLGLDRLNVGHEHRATPTGGTENQGAAIQAGRYISKRVYVEGKQSTTGDQPGAGGRGPYQTFEAANAARQRHRDPGHDSRQRSGEQHRSFVWDRILRSAQRGSLKIRPVSP